MESSLVEVPQNISLSPQQTHPHINLQTPESPQNDNSLTSQIMISLTPTSPTTFSFWFTLQGHKYTFAGSFNYAVPHFACSASLHYSHPYQLTGRKTFTGTLGRFFIELKLSDGVVIKGRLIPPIMRALFVSGCGRWQVKELHSIQDVHRESSYLA